MRKKVITFIEKIFDKVVLAFLLLASVYLRYKYTPLVEITGGGSDYKTYTIPWVDFYRENGIVKGLSIGIGDYYIPYNLVLAFASLFDCEPFYIFCPFSYIFEYIMVLYLYKTVMLLMGLEGSKELSEKDKYIKCWIALLLVLPMVVANGAIWKQSDAVYAALICVAFYYFAKKKYTLTFIWVGVAFSLKFQTVFIIPFLLMVYFVQKEFSILQFFWIPAMYLIAGLPAVLCGQRITHVYGTYYRQMNEYGAMTINAPVIYVIGLTEYMYHHVAIVITMAAFAFMLAYLIINKIDMNVNFLFYLAGWSVMTCFEFLPSMHERYDYLAIVILTVIAMIFRHRIIPAVITMHLVSACTYGSFLFLYPVNFTVAAIAYLAAYCWITYDLIVYSRE